MCKRLENEQWIDEMCPCEDVQLNVEFDQELFLFNDNCENNNEYFHQVITWFDLDDNPRLEMELSEIQDLLLQMENDIQM